MRMPWQDIRHDMRMLGNNLGFASIAVLTLALGVGVNTAVFSLVDVVLFRPLPIAKPNERETKCLSFSALPAPSFAASPPWIPVRASHARPLAACKYFQCSQRGEGS